MNVFLLIAFTAISLKFYTLPNIWRGAIGYEPIKTKAAYYARLYAIGEDFPTDPEVIFTRWSMFPIVVRPSAVISLVASNQNNTCVAYVVDPYPEKDYGSDPGVDFNNYVFLVTNSNCTRVSVKYGKPPKSLTPAPQVQQPLVR